MPSCGESNRTIEQRQGASYSVEVLAEQSVDSIAKDLVAPTRLVECLQSSLGQGDPKRAPIGRHGGPLEVLSATQALDECGDRRLGDPGLFRECAGGARLDLRQDRVGAEVSGAKGGVREKPLHGWAE
jgi:hypothetical protein